MNRPVSRLHKGGSAEFRFTLSPDGLTYISHQAVAYPFHVTRPFYLEGDPKGMATLYLQSVSGGLFDEDVVNLTLHADDNARAHVTTQSSTIVHSTETSYAEQQTCIHAGEHACIEYLPDPLVLFPRAHLHSQIRVVADKTASVVVCDGFLAHDPEGVGAMFERLSNELRIESPDGKLRCLDRFEVSGQELSSYNEYRAHGAFVFVDGDVDETTRLALSKSLMTVNGIYAGVSSLPDDAGLWSRILALDSQSLRNAISVAWTTLRELKTGVRPHPRRK